MGNMERGPLDFVAVGDIVTDAFIRLKEAHVADCVDHDAREICMTFGDKIPYESVEVVSAVGNSPNAATAAARLGLSSGLVTNIGDDHNGGECLATLKKNGVSTELVTTHRLKLTNYHYVLWYRDERTILIKHEKYDYKLPDFAAPRWMYLSSIGEHTVDYHREIAAYLKKNTGTRLAFQPGTFQMKMGVEGLRELYKLTKAFFCNVEEAKRILGIIENVKVPELLKRLHETGPETVVITDGPRGAYAYDGVDGLFMPPYPDPKPPCERTGAGDAFASTVVSALALGKPLSEALRWGPINSMSVVQQVGAQKGLLSRENLEKYLADAPADYKPMKVF